MSEEPARPGRIATRRIHSGRILQLDIDTVRFPDGNTGELEIFRHPGAAAVLPIVRPGADPTIVLIRQYRYATGGDIWEIPAGRLDPGESPETCARRELLEEIGGSAERWERLTEIYPGPGFCDERITLFVAHGVQTDAGAVRREPDEFMQVVEMPLSRSLGLIERGEIVDGKTICAVLCYAAFRPSL